SSHMIDLSEESLHENIEICSKYLARMSKIGMTLEIELGCTGGVPSSPHWVPSTTTLLPIFQNHRLLKNGFYHRFFRYTALFALNL
ncbi:class II fructose-bisphosphate aldolase, partial [Salmonella enterica subsp. enterica serovar Anatum]|nr:class II fructose-bisphosphate aldolase [Salmonella enterica subsp. enterica serovar Anatum]